MSSRENTEPPTIPWACFCSTVFMCVSVSLYNHLCYLLKDRHTVQFYEIILFTVFMEHIIIDEATKEHRKCPRDLSLPILSYSKVLRIILVLLFWWRLWFGSCIQKITGLFEKLAALVLATLPTCPCWSKHLDSGVTCHAHVIKCVTARIKLIPTPN